MTDLKSEVNLVKEVPHSERILNLIKDHNDRIHNTIQRAKEINSSLFGDSPEKEPPGNEEEKPKEGFFNILDNLLGNTSRQISRMEAILGIVESNL